MRILLAGLVMLGTPAAVGGVEPPARVTTDSSEYCTDLALRLASLPGSREEPALSLAADGIQLCETGHTRTGVAKLRRAIRAARGGD
jgi:hypothetical protein